jgi:SAM-dependent methyltransferase
MAHLAQKIFFKEVKDKYPERFKGCSVLDIGSLDINGNNHYLFEDYTYIGVDVGDGRNVDVVSKGHEYKSEKLFDIVISSECFEHDMYYPETILNCISLTKPGGLFTFTCASEGRPEHGTNRTKPQDAPLLKLYEDWGNYYKNLTENDVREIFNPDDYFSEYEFKYNPKDFDLYFWGIKKTNV